MTEMNVATSKITWLQALVEEPQRDLAVGQLGSRFLLATPEERVALRQGWSFDVEWPYPAPARLACRLGEGQPPETRIVASLVLDWLDGVFGTREHLIALCATYRSCELAGLSPTQVFESVASALPAEEGEELRAFLRRSPDERRLTAFGLVERTNSDGEVEVDLQP